MFLRYSRKIHPKHTNRFHGVTNLPPPVRPPPAHVLEMVFDTAPPGVGLLSFPFSEEPRVSTFGSGRGPRADFILDCRGAFSAASAGLRSK